MTALLLAGMALLVLVNGFFVAAEFAYVRVNRSRLEALAQTHRGAAVARRHLDDISHYLAACQFGITLASLGIGFLGEPAIASLVEPVLGGVASHAVSVALALLFAYVVSTAAHITVGEQVPKMFAIANAETVARRVARPLGVFTAVFGPAITVLDRTSNAMLRPLGVDTSLTEDPADVRQLIAESVAGGGLEHEEAEMLSGVLKLSELEARRVMTPLPAVVDVRDDEELETALDRCIETGHTRLLVRAGDGAPVGAVHVNDLARAARRGSPGGPALLRHLARPAPTVPETRRLDDLLADLQRDRASMAAVVDEYGRLAGIVTVEDIVEEIVGEIVDETDPSVAAVRRLPDGALVARGEVALQDLADDHDVHLPASEAVSIGGWVFDRLGRLPRRGDAVDADGLRVSVDTVREHRVESVRISRT